MYKHHFVGTDYDLETGEAHMVVCMYCDCKPYQASEFPCVDEEQEARGDYLLSVHLEETRMEEI